MAGAAAATWAYLLLRLWKEAPLKPQPAAMITKQVAGVAKTRRRPAPDDDPERRIKTRVAELLREDGGDERPVLDLDLGRDDADDADAVPPPAKTKARAAPPPRQPAAADDEDEDEDEDGDAIAEEETRERLDEENAPLPPVEVPQPQPQTPARPATKRRKPKPDENFAFDDGPDDTPAVTLRTTNHEWPTHAWGKGGKGMGDAPPPKTLEEVAGLVLSEDLAYPGIDLVVTKQNYRKLKKGDHIQNLRNLPDTSPYEPQPGPCKNGAAECARKDRLRERRPFESCALVGNSGAVRSAPFGPSIDKHDIVLRINQAPVRSYERYVGSRTDLRLLNRKWVSLYTSAEEGRKTLLPNEQPNSTLLISRVSSAEFEHLSSLVRKQRPDVGVSYMANGAVTRSRWMLSAYREAMGGLDDPALRVVYRGGDVPSSGFIGLYFLMQACERIAVYGLCVERASSKLFRTFSYHYFSNYLDSTQLRAHPHHSFQAEGELVTLLQRLGSTAVGADGLVAHRASTVKLCLGPANLTREEKIELAECGVYQET